MSDFIIFKAAFNNSATPAIGTYTAEGATAQFNKNTGISPDYYLYNTTDNTAVQWFVPTAETTDFEFVADILTRNWTNRVTYFIIADSAGTTRLRMWSQYSNWIFENSDSIAGSGNPEYIGTINPDTSGGFGVFHQFRVRVRKLTASSSSVEIYVDGTLKLTATAGAALITCAKIGFVGGVNTFGPGIDVGIKNAYVYDLSGGEVIDRGVLSGAFTRFINWMKSVFALKSDIPTVNNGTLTIQQNGTSVQTFTANQSTAATANIQCVDLSTAQTVAGNKTFSGNTKFTSTATIEKSTGDVELLIKNTAVDSTSVSANAVDDIRFTDSSDRITGSMRISYDTSNGVTAMMYARSYSADGSVSSTNGISITSNQQTGAARANVSANLLPNSTDTYDLGSSAAQWNNAYTRNILIDNDINIASSLINKTSTSGVISIRGGINTQDGASIGLYGKDYNGAIAGNIYMTAYGNSDYTNFRIYPSGVITVYNNSTATTKNVAMQEDTIPRSGGAVITGTRLGRNVDDNALRMDGGSDWEKGSSVVVFGKDHLVSGGKVFFHASNSTLGANMYLSYDGTWTWSGQAVQLVSDQRLKQQITEIDDKLLDAWEDVDLVQFKYNDAVDQKKDKARLHTGYVVQQIQKACESHGVDISQYGLFCHEEYPEETEEVEIEQADGTKTKERKVIREASEHYSLRYTEVYAVECMYLRRCIKQLTARIEQLEKDKEQEANK